MEKYELISETKVINGVELHRIKALDSFGSVKKGELGGWVESEKNLSQGGDAWVYENATVCGDATVYENATVRGNAIVFGDAKVCGDAKVYENAVVGENAEVGGYAKVRGNAMVCGNATISDNATVRGNAIIFGDAKICGNATVDGDAKVCGNATVRGKEDYIVFKNWWSSERYFTWTRSNNKWKVGFFYGSGEELIAKAYKDSEKIGREYERVVKYVESILKEENNNK